jgi:hypothetical protein
MLFYFFFVLQKAFLGIRWNEARNVNYIPRGRTELDWTGLDCREFGGARIIIWNSICRFGI